MLSFCRLADSWKVGTWGLGRDEGGCIQTVVCVPPSTVRAFAVTVKEPQSARPFCVVLTDASTTAGADTFCAAG